MSLIDQMKRLQDSGLPFALVTVIETHSSTPRDTGTQMIVDARERILGTIGGGPVEKNAARTAGEMLREGAGDRLLKFSLDTVPEGDRHGEEADGLMDTGAICGGDMSVFIKCFHPPARLVIAGGGHIAEALYGIAKEMDFGITIVDNRPEFASVDRFPGAEVILGDYREIFSDLPVNSPTYFVIITHGHKHDQDVLDAVVEKDWKNVSYVGMIGSRHKVGKVLERSLEKGLSREKLSRVRSPIGLDIGALSPWEIGVAIMAEIISVRRGKDEKGIAAMSISSSFFD